MSENTGSENLFQFACPKCGGKHFKRQREIKTVEDMLGATCASCGTPLNEDINAQARKNVEDTIRRKFGEGGMKIKL